MALQMVQLQLCSQRVQRHTMMTTQCRIEAGAIDAAAL